MSQREPHSHRNVWDFDSLAHTKNSTQNRIHLRVVNVMEQRGVLCCLLLFRPNHHCDFSSDEYRIRFHSISECLCTHFDDDRKHFWWHSMFTKSNSLTTHFHSFFLSVFAVYLFTSVECQTAHYWTMSRWRTALFRVANTLTDSGRLSSHESERQIGRRGTSNTNVATNKTKRNRSHTTHRHMCSHWIGWRSRLLHTYSHTRNTNENSFDQFG